MRAAHIERKGFAFARARTAVLLRFLFMGKAIALPIQM
jgi:hypothetical protein